MNINTRPPLERMRSVKAALERGATLPELAEDLEVSIKTLRRDLEFMRDRLGFRCAYHWERRRWECPRGQTLL